MSSKRSMSKGKGSIIQPNGKVDIQSLQNEIMTDISNDALYYAENEMKKRAVHTSVDYDEFQKFVSCSQLKPVDSRDMGQLFVQQGGQGYRQDGSLSSSSSSSLSFLKSNKAKACSIQQNNEKRISAMLNDMSASNTIDTATTDTTDTTDTCSIRTATSVSLEALSISNNNNTNMTATTTTNTALDHVLNLNLKTKTTGKKKKMTRKKTKNNSKSNGKNKSNSQNRNNSNSYSHTYSHGYSHGKKNKYGPQNAMEFEKEWKLNCHTTNDILNYLTLSRDSNTIDTSTDVDMTNVGLIVKDVKDIPFSIPDQFRIEPEQISIHVCKVEMNSNIMGDIIQVMEKCILYTLISTTQYKDTGMDTDVDIDMDMDMNMNMNEKQKVIRFVYRWMYALTQCGRFHLNIDFLDNHQKQCISSIFDRLESSIALTVVDVDVDDDDGNIDDVVSSTSTELNNGRLTQKTMFIRKEDIVKLRSLYIHI